MYKKVLRGFCFFLNIIFLIASYGSYEVKAAEAKPVKVEIPQFPVIINGQVIDNEYNQYPLLVYNNITYLPLTYYGCGFLGIKIAWYENKQVFYIGSDSITESKLAIDGKQTQNEKEYTAYVFDYKVAVNTIDSDEFLENEKISYPVLNFRGITYLPLTWNFAVCKFDWKLTFDCITGLCIDTDDVNRPILEDSQIGDSSPLRGLRKMQYVFSSDAYAGFPESTLDGFYKFAYKKREQEEITFSFEDQLSEGDYYFNYELDTNGYLNPNPEIEPSLDGSILSVACVRYSGVSPNYTGKNLILKIDMESEKIISEEFIPLLEATNS